MLEKMLENVRAKSPLVHAITNYVTVNDCANMVLASGGSPIMADDINEVCDITAICSALVINMGTLNERTVASMITAGKKANELHHPVVFDPVGASASAFRNQTAERLLREVQFSVIRGNISEIKFLASGTGNTQGVDAAVSDAVTAENVRETAAFSRAFSKRTGAVIAITGATDIVTDSEKVYLIHNGHPMMSRITGTGCMLSALIGSYIGANPTDLLHATAAAVTAMGLCGELAHNNLVKTNGGTGTYRTLLMDAMSLLDVPTLREGMKIEAVE